VTDAEFDLSLKSIARVIGFKDSIQDSFLPIREMEISKSEDGTKQMTSLVVREPSGSLQFFSRGDLEFILDHCSGAISLPPSIPHSCIARSIIVVEEWRLSAVPLLFGT
jgi:hypothetical protein